MKWVILLASLLAGAALREAACGNLPIEQSLVGASPLVAGTELRVAGRNDGPGVTRLILRIDDGRSIDYANRVNDERLLPTGPFVLRWPLQGLVTPSGRLLDTDDLRRFILFAISGRADITIDGVTVVPPPQFPAGVIALDLGPRSQATFPGLTPVAPGDERIRGQLEAIRRPGPDSLIADGIRGIERIRLKVAPGRYVVSLWTEDPGEWEWLPHPLRRHITVNGTIALDERRRSDEWVRQRWLSGRDREPAFGQIDAWSEIGRHRGGLRSVAVEAPHGEIRIEFTGDTPDAGFLAALVAEPAGPSEQAPVRDRLEDMRAERFREQWRVIPMPRPTPTAIAPLVLEGGPGTFVHTDIWISPLRRDPPHWIEPAPFPIDVRVAQRRLQRVGTSESLLIVKDSVLRGDLANWALDVADPRRVVISARIPDRAKPGTYAARLSLMGAEIPIEVRILNVRLPDLEQSIGVYLDDLPTGSWFTDFYSRIQAQRRCDFDLLSSLGFSTVAPPSTGIDADAFAAELAELSTRRLDRDPLIYAEPKRLLARIGHDATVRQIQERDAKARARGITPLWAMADEPSNPDQWAGKGLDRLMEELRRVAPELRIAGQLNAPADRPRFSTFDVALINPGFGIDSRVFANTGSKPVAFWLYNTRPGRIAAGLYSWRIGARGFLQWHARMPTADPFDPTDGRESDVMLLPPMPDVCAPVPDLHDELIDLADGALDRRWLAWLDREASRNAMATALRDALHFAAPTRWKDAESFDSKGLSAYRRAIMALAGRLNPGGE